MSVDVANLPSLQVDDVRGESEAHLIARGAAYVREYVRIEHAPTILLKNIAAVVVALRLQHDDPLGRKQEYRNSVGEMYRMSGISPDSQATTQSAVRWHVGNLLRDALPARELKALPLKKTSPLERQQNRRSVNAALLKSTTAVAAVSASTPKKAKGAATAADEARVPEQGGHAVKATADHLRLAGVGLGLFRQLDVTVIDEHMTDGQRAKLDDELAELQKLLAKLRRHTKKRRSEG
ncbi:hypothetical protein [Streptomyces sp. NPDC086782]|uniref:hypothetical protein n=1 Tax=Streptomyces sp. NPDC086782 TaxID=3365757 RepID=UPI00381586EC